MYHNNAYRPLPYYHHPSLPVPLQVSPPYYAPPPNDPMRHWVHRELTAAGEIIDLLLNHISNINTNVQRILINSPTQSDYAPVIEAIQRRRKSWDPYLFQLPHMPADDSIDGQLQKLANMWNVLPELHEEREGSSSSSSLPKTEQQQQAEEPITSMICSDHENCLSRRNTIKIRRGFSVIEHVEGRMLNIVKGLKIYDNVFTKSDISILSNFIDQLRKDYSGNGKLSITPDNHQVNDRIQNEVIELAVLPPILSNTINHLCEWHLLPETRKPTSCVIAFFDEDKFSKPAGLCKVAYDLQKPISMLFLNDTKMIFGQDIPYDHNGDCKEGSFLELSIEEGSVLVMRGNSVDVAQSMICPSPNKRVCITFFRASQPILACNNGVCDLPMHMKMTPWNSASQTLLPSGTGVFFPGRTTTILPKKYSKRLPPRIKRMQQQ
ncbi:hypothetical protein ZOSMA_25G00610 [Zostera marina]|uniref:Uncharacterized protein n=1 Tax=Zostera marina TaxID=29655 RepID=A0A0K9PFD7_ZOSMR|nr:hypothetical protein ZOSMA_25G00610 [Zostera marina]